MREHQKELRSLFLDGKLSVMGMVLLQGGEISHKATNGVPEHLLKIYKFKQINNPEDFNIPSKTWKKIKAYLEKIDPAYKKKSKEMLQEIEDFKEQSEFKRLLYITNFVFMPSESITKVLVMKAALAP